MGPIIIWAGHNITSSGHNIFNSVIIKFKTIFVGPENDKAFTYIGINIKQKGYMSISIDQHTYAESLKSMPLNKEQLLDHHQRLNESEASSSRSAMDQLI